MLEVYIVTHGDKSEGPNPGMTPNGYKQIRTLAHLVPSVPTKVVCGTGVRHDDVARALKLRPNECNPRAGMADSLEMSADRRMICLASGQLVPFAAYRNIGEDAEETGHFVCSLPDQTAVCAGRPLMNAIPRPYDRTGASAAVYCVGHDGEKILNITCLAADGNEGAGYFEV